MGEAGWECDGLGRGVVLVGGVWGLRLLCPGREFPPCGQIRNWRVPLQKFQEGAGMRGFGGG